MTPRQRVTAALVCAIKTVSGWSSKGAAVELVLVLVNECSQSTKACRKTDPKFLPPLFCVLLKHLLGAAVSASERCASQSLKVADEPGGGLLFRL